ncbi:hypothetical protein GCM10010510_03270 [Streptomyces anandii JCM 4720]|nr:hypothetical protein GCM10010510_03270 [Streptomyces anandii JCM 4720]
MPAAAHQVGGPGLQRARVELGGLQQRVLRGNAVGLAQRGVRVRHARLVQYLTHGVVGEPLQTAQDVRGAGRARQGGEPLVQGEFVGAARAREQPQPPHLGQRRRQLGARRTGPASARAVRLQGGAQHLEADVGVTRVGGAAGGLGRYRPRRGPAAGERPLDEGVRGQDPPAPAQPRRQHQVGQPDQPRVVLDERGLGLLDIDDRLGERRGTRGDIL